MANVRVEEIDPFSAGDDVLRARYDAHVAISEELEPEQPVAPFDHHKLELTKIASFEKPRHVVAWSHGGERVAGYATLYLEYTETNRHLSWFEIGVLPGERRQHVGAALLREVAEMARADGRTVVGAGSIEGHAGDDFARSMGFECKATERKSRLVTAKVDRELMDRWVKSAEAAASDYELVAYDGPTPDDLIDAFVDLYHVTNTAPRDDLDMEDEVLTPERLREKEQRMVEMGTERWRILARHVPTGQLAGFTEFWFPKHTRTFADQGWTAVRTEHRNHGIGRWLKAVNVLRLLDERPEVEAVDTWNAFSNGPMLGINIAMGFELVRGYNDWQAPTDRVADLAKQRLGA